MLESFTTLEETAERFYREPEFIWNLSLSFAEQLRPDLGEAGRVVFSSQQRQTIGRILKLREQGLNDLEIRQTLEWSLPDPVSAVGKAITVESLPCSGNEKCKNNFKILADQIKFLYKQLCLVQSELDAMQKGGIGDEVCERIFPAA